VHGACECVDHIMPWCRQRRLSRSCLILLLAAAPSPWGFGVTFVESDRPFTAHLELSDDSNLSHLMKGLLTDTDRSNVAKSALLEYHAEGGGSHQPGADETSERGGREAEEPQVVSATSVDELNRTDVPEALVTSANGSDEAGVDEVPERRHEQSIASGNENQRLPGANRLKGPAHEVILDLEKRVEVLEGLIAQLSKHGREVDELRRNWHGVLPPDIPPSLSYNSFLNHARQLNDEVGTLVFNIETKLNDAAVTALGKSRRWAHVIEGLYGGLHQFKSAVAHFRETAAKMGYNDAVTAKDTMLTALGPNLGKTIKDKPLEDPYRGRIGPLLDKGIPEWGEEIDHAPAAPHVITLG